MVLYGTDQLTQRVQARQLLSMAAQEHWRLSPLPPLERHELGKPFFPGFPQHQFNLSHSGSLALCALDDQPVGVDIQVIKPWRKGLPERTCSPGELDWLAGQPDADTAFSLLWSLKEACVKQSGLGLRSAIRAISVPLPPDHNEPILWNGLWFHAYQGVGWTAAACGATPPPKKIHWRVLSENASLQSR